MSSNYEELSIERKRLQQEGSLPEWYQTGGYQLLKSKYLWKDSTLKETFQRMADTAIQHLDGKLPKDEVDYLHRRFFEIMWDGHLAPASPVYNLGTPRGLPVSCSGGIVRDSVEGFYHNLLEVAVLTQEQFGTSGYLGYIRPRGSKISRGGTAAGIVPVLNALAQSMRDITQGTTRRGSYAAYFDVMHGDFYEIIQSVESDPEDKNIGINYYDVDINNVLSNDEYNETFKRWQRHMKFKSIFGKGYFYFPDKVHRHQPDSYKNNKQFTNIYNINDVVEVYVDYRIRKLSIKDVLALFEKNKGDNKYSKQVRLLTETKTMLYIVGYSIDGDTVTIKSERRLKSKASNLCTEIILHADELHTYACVLSSMNGSKFDEWKDTDAVYVATIFLDCVNEELIKLAKNIPEMANIVRGAEKGRPLGLGLLGFHTYLQEHNIPFESVDAIHVNDEIFKHLHDESLRASQYLAKHFGTPEWCDAGVRNTHRTALAPNMASATLAGQVSQGIEPIFSNTYNQKMAGGTVMRINPTLLRIMKERGVYSQELVDRIGIELNGSVQSDLITFLTPHEKLVFKTANEISQYTILDLANDRQENICQAQSINLFFKHDTPEDVIADVTQYGMSLERILSLYYQRMEASSKGSNGKAETKQVECVACQA